MSFLAISALFLLYIHFGKSLWFTWIPCNEASACRVSIIKQQQLQLTKFHTSRTRWSDSVGVWARHDETPRRLFVLSPVISSDVTKQNGARVSAASAARRWRKSLPRLQQAPSRSLMWMFAIDAGEKAGNSVATSWLCRSWEIKATVLVEERPTWFWHRDWTIIFLVHKRGPNVVLECELSVRLVLSFLLKSRASYPPRVGNKLYVWLATGDRDQRKLFCAHAVYLWTRPREVHCEPTEEKAGGAGTWETISHRTGEDCLWCMNRPRGLVSSLHLKSSLSTILLIFCSL